MKFLLIVLLFVGCRTPNTNQIIPNNAKQYKVKPFTIIVLHPNEIDSIATNYFNYPVIGFYHSKSRTMYVPYGSETNEFTNQILPNMYILGHEVLHLQEVEGGWHK